MHNCDDNLLRIQLYVDGELTQEEAESMLAHLKTCIACQQAFEELKAYSARIRNSRPDIKAPEHLRANVLRRIQASQQVASGPVLVSTSQPRKRTWVFGAAAVAAVLLIGVLALFQYEPNKPNPIIESAILMHHMVEQNSLPLDITSDSPEEVTKWFAKRVSFPFRMANDGIASDQRAMYKLVGGRLVAVGNLQAALLDFRFSGQTVTMLVGPGNLITHHRGKMAESDGIKMYSQDRDSLHVVTWENHGLNYVLTSEKSMGDVHKCSSCHASKSAMNNPGSESSSPIYLSRLIHSRSITVLN